MGRNFEARHRMIFFEICRIATGGARDEKESRPRVFKETACNSPRWFYFQTPRLPRKEVNLPDLKLLGHSQKTHTHSQLRYKVKTCLRRRREIRLLSADGIHTRGFAAEPPFVWYLGIFWGCCTWFHLVPSWVKNSWPRIRTLEPCCNFSEIPRA